MSERFAYWRVALRFYVKAALVQSAAVWISALVIPPVLWILHIQQYSVRAVLATMAFGVGIGVAFFLAILGTAIGYDLKRNWHQSEPVVEWNPLLFWKLCLYAGSLTCVTLAFLSYRQGWWPRIGFVGFALLCWFAARSLAVTVRLPKSPLSDPLDQGHGPRHEKWAGGHLHPGFVGMEYFALMLNRSFLVFITDEGLRCWKFHGVVSSLEPLFYESAEALLDVPAMTPGSEAFEELMRRPHTFFLPYSEINSVEFVDRPKWGMGPVPHSGRLYIRFRGSGLRREFILLGNAQGQVIRDLIISRIEQH